MQIRTRLKTKRPENAFEAALEEELLSFIKELATLLNGGLKFSDNQNAETVNVTDTGAANTEFTVSHTLKRVPVGFIVVDINKAAAVYNSGSAWTTSAVYLKVNAANCNVKVFVY